MGAISNSTAAATAAAAAAAAAAFHVGVSMDVDTVARTVATTNSTAATAPAAAVATTSTFVIPERDQVSLKHARLIIAQNDKGNKSDTEPPILVTTGGTINGESQHI